MDRLSPAAQREVDAAAERNGFSAAAGAHMCGALLAGNGRMAQFNHLEFGGVGQWMRGGMTMIGDMFNMRLKARVDRLCDELESILAAAPEAASAAGAAATGATAEPAGWWRPALGRPNAAGSQNDMRYAYFRAVRRLAVETSGDVTIYDTLDHDITGVAQQQSARGTLTFATARGTVDLATLPIVPAAPAAGAGLTPRHENVAHDFGGAPTIIAGTRCRLRPWAAADLDVVARLADDFAVARWMTAMFPHPYTFDDARAWLANTTTQTPVDDFAIEVDGALVGGAGIIPQTGEQRGVAEFGYWLGRAFWSRGIATEAAALLAGYALNERGLRRLQAHVFAANASSARVLEKNGFVREARLRELFVERDGTISDGFLYARLKAG